MLAQHEDHSQEDKLAGIKTTLVRAGKFKAEANPYEPLSDDAREELQHKVDSYHALFVRDVAKGRAMSEARVRSDFGKGRMLLANDAVKTGMADGVEPLDQVVKRLVAGVGRGPAAAGPVNRLAPYYRRLRETGGE